MNTTTPSPRLFTRKSAVVALATMISAPALFAADGTWTLNNTGDWTATANWAGAVIADGSGFTANFTTDLTADRQVNLRAARTIGNLVFSDPAVATAASWTIGNSGTETFQMTLAGATPTITVNPLGAGKLAVINVITNSTAGLRKEGTGILRLSQTNNGLTGNLVINNGTLQLGNSGAINNVASNIMVNANAGVGATGNVQLQLNDGITAGNGKTVTLTSAAGVSRTALNGGSGSNWQGNVVLAGTNPNAIQATSGNGNFTLSGNVTGGGAATFFRGAGLGNITGNVNITTPFFKTDPGTWTVSSTGNNWLVTQAADGAIQLGINDALPTTVPLVIGQASATNGRFELNGFNQTVTALRTDPGSTATAMVIRNANLTTASTLNFTTADATTDVLKGTNIHNAGALTLVKSGTGRFEMQDVRADNTAIVVNAGTLAFTGTGERVVRAAVSGLAAATIDKAGTGVTNLAGTFNHAGATTVSAGRLHLGNGTAASIAVADGATLGAGLNGGRLTADSLSFGAGGATSFLATLGNPATPLITATSLSTAGTTVKVSVEAASFTPGTFPLIGYTGAIGGNGFGGFALDTTPGQMPHITAALDDSVAGRVNLNITAVDSLIWTGATDGNFAVNGAANFSLNSNTSTPASFFQSDSVFFGDTADLPAPGTPVVNRAITVVGAPRVGNLTFDNSLGNDYTLTGAMAGPGGILKTNSGAVTLASANALTGPIQVFGGTLILGGANVGHGAVEVQGGTLRLGQTDAISGGALVTISNGGTLDVNGLAPNIRIPEIRVSGSGVGDAGAIVNNGAGITNLNHALRITLEGDTTWGGSGRYDVVNFVNGGNFTLTKVGAGELWYQPTAGSTLGNVIVNGGTFGSQTVNPLAATSTVTVNNGAFHSIFSTVSLQHQAVLNDGGTLRTATSGAPIFNGSVTLNGSDANRFLAAIGTNTLNVAGQITGTGGFTKNDTGTVQLRNSGNNYLGDTIVNLGTLNFSAAGRLPTTTDLIVNGGTFDPSNLTHTVASLSGAGGVLGQGTAGTGVIVTTQSNATTFAGAFVRSLLRMNGMGSLTLTGTADNSTGLAEVNAGTLVLAKTGTLAVHSIGSAALGLTINSGGTVQLGGSQDGTAGTGSNLPPAAVPANYLDQIFNFTDVVVNAGGVFDLTGFSEAIDGLSGGGTVRSSVAGATNSRLYVGYNNATDTFSGAIQDGAGVVELTKLGTGALTLSGSNTYTGATTISAGSVNLTGSLGDTAVTLAAGTSLNVPGSIGAGALTIGANATVNVAGSIGNGPVSLAAGSSLAVTGSLGSGGVTVASGARLTGNGVVGGAVTLDGTLFSSNTVGSVTANNGSTINVGGADNAAAATLNTAAFTLGAGGARTLAFDFDGVTIDRINANAANGLTLDGTNNVTILFPNGGGFKTGSYPVFGYNGALQGAGASTLVLQNPVGHNTVTFANNAGGQTVDLQVTAVDLIWKGSTNGNFDLNATTNWELANAPGAPVTFLNGDNAVFNDTSAVKAVTLNSTVTPSSVTFDTSDAYTLGGTGAIAGTGSLTKKGPGALTVSNPNTYTGRTVVEAGVLTLNYSTAAPVAAVSELNTATGATLRIAHNDGNITLGNALTGGGTVVLDPRAAAVGSVVREVLLNGNNAGFSGILNLAPTTGSFRAVVDNANDLGVGFVDVDSGGQVFVSTPNLTFANNFSISGTGYVEAAGNLGAIRAANPSTFTGVINVDGAAKIGAHGGVANLAGTMTGGTLTVGGNNTASTNETFVFTGDASALAGLVINDASAGAGTITATFGNGIASGEIGTAPITINSNAKGGVLRFNQGNDYALAAPVSSTGNTTLQADTLAGNMTGKGLAVSGGINLNAGTLQVGSPNIANNAIGKLTIEAGANITAANLNVGEQSLKQGLVDQTDGAVGLSAQMRIGHWPNETSTYNLSGGTINMSGSAGAFPYSAAVAEQNGGVYLGIDGTGIMNHSGGTLSTSFIVLDNRGNSGAGTNQVDGIDRYNLSAGGLLEIKSGFGIISRNASAAVDLAGGTIRAVSSFNLDTDRITVSGSPTFDTNANTITDLGPLAGAGTIAVTGGGTFRTADSAAVGGGSLGAVSANVAAGSTLQSDRTGSQTWSGSLSGAGALSKTNSGTLTLSGDSSGFAGPTTVTGGTLLVTGSLSGSAIAVNSGATLGGSGSTGAVTSVGGIIAPGTSPGTLSTGAFSLDSASVLRFELATPGVVGSGVNDLLAVGGALTLDGTLQVTQLPGFAFGTYRLATYSGGLTDNGLALEQGFLDAYPGSAIEATGGQVNLVVIPEPGTAVALLSGLGMLLGLQRFRRLRASRS